MEALDISTTFLNGDIDGGVYVKQPPGLVDKDHPHNKVWKLRNKSLYGLGQSPRIWYLTLRGFLLEQNFVRTTVSPVSMNSSTGEETMVAVYVDDLVISSSHPSIVSDLKSSFASRFKITDLGRWRSHSSGLH